MFSDIEKEKFEQRRQQSQAAFDRAQADAKKEAPLALAENNEAKLRALLDSKQTVLIDLGTEKVSTADNYDADFSNTTDIPKDINDELPLLDEAAIADLFQLALSQDNALARLLKDRLSGSKKSEIFNHILLKPTFTRSE